MKTLIVIFTIFVSMESFAYGPYTHLFIADKSYNVASDLLKDKFPQLSEEEIHNLLSYYNAGSLGPDFGYFPNGDLQASLLAHYLRSGDLITTMLNLSETPEEYAFTLGWKTHVDSDEFAHRDSVNKTSAEVLGIDKIYPKGVSYSFDPLVHNRVEMGGDLKRFIEYPSTRNIHYTIRVPLEPRFQSGRNFIEEAYLRVYAYRISRNALTTVARNLSEDVNSIQEVFVAMGKLPPTNKEGLDKAVESLNVLAMRPFFKIFMGGDDNLGSSATINPYLMNDEQWQRHDKSTKIATYHVKKRLLGDHMQIPNRNTDNGGPIFLQNYDPSADLLIQIEKNHPEKVWANEYPQELANKLTSDWNRILRQYDRRTK